MSKPFDAASKGLIDADPIAWLRFLHLPGDSVELVDTDLTSALTSDRLLRVSTPGKPDYLLHIELQATNDPGLCHRALAYHVAAGYKYGMQVITVIVLLRKSADGNTMTGHFQFGAAQFEYQVVRIWEQAPDEILNGPVTLLPLLPLTRVTERELPAFLSKMQTITEQLPNSSEQTIWMQTHMLLGLKYKREKRQDMLKGVFQMLDLRESSTYQDIFAEGEARGLAEGEARGEARGRAEGERDVVILLGSKRFGEPDSVVQSELARITSPQRLILLASRLLEVESWGELLAD